MISNKCLRINGCIYRGKKLLFCINNLELACRGIVAIVGENGSGKSTLLKNIAGILSTINGNIWSAKPVSYMPEEHFAPPPAKVKEWLWLNKVSGEKAIKSGLPNSLLKVKISKLSHGWKRFVELLSVVALYAKLYLLDEPFYGMDPDKIAIATKLIIDAAKRGLVLVTGHDEAFFSGWADKILVIRGERLETTRNA